MKLFAVVGHSVSAPVSGCVASVRLLKGQVNKCFILGGHGDRVPCTPMFEDFEIKLLKQAPDQRNSQAISLSYMHITGASCQEQFNQRCH